MSGFKAYRVTAQGKFEPMRLDLLLIGIWLVLLALVGLVWWGAYEFVRFLLG